MGKRDRHEQTQKFTAIWGNFSSSTPSTIQLISREMEHTDDANYRRRSVHKFLSSFPLPTRRPSRAHRVSMPPSLGDAQTPEPKSTNGLVSVFKSLTGGKQTRSPNSHHPAAIASQLNGASSSPPTLFGGPPNYEQLYEQLKIGNPLIDRLAAAEAIRHAVQDFPLSGVGSMGKCHGKC